MMNQFEVWAIAGVRRVFIVDMTEWRYSIGFRRIVATLD